MFWIREWLFGWIDRFVQWRIDAVNRSVDAGHDIYD